MINKVELLAPAGSKESFFAAVNSGANAVYMGGKNFNARHYSNNFTNEELKELVKYAHNKNVKVYITVNIILKDNEILEALNYVKYLYEINVDAVIVQDLGLIYLINKLIPNFSINVSTQASIYDKYGIEFFNDIKINRFILARELSLDEIKVISKSTDKKVETFIHGALCMSYSGQCYSSSFFGGRSGNRGKCAQPCRLNYNFVDKNGRELEEYKDTPLLSLKDYKSGESTIDLIKNGVYTLKIEGRMKSPEYTSIVVQYYRALIDNYLYGKEKILYSLEKKVESVFSRGFTNGYLLNNRQSMMAGISSNCKVNNVESIVEEVKDRINPYGNFNRIDIDVDIIIKIGENIKLSMFDGINKIVVYSNSKVEESVNKPISIGIVKEQISKLGNTIFKIKSFNIQCEEGSFVKKSELNEIRRMCTKKLYEVRANIHNRIKEEEITKFDLNNLVDINKLKKVDSKISFKINNLDDLKYIDNRISRIYVPYDFNIEYIKDIKCNEKYLCIPNIMSEEQYNYCLENMSIFEENYNGVCVNNIGSFYFFEKNSKLIIHCGYFFNIINKYNVDYLFRKGARSVTLSCESNIKDIKSISEFSNCKIEIPAYMYVQLMTMKNCPFSVLKGCNSKGNCEKCEYSKEYMLKDRKNKYFNIERDNNISRLYNSVPVTILDRVNKFSDSNIDYYLIDSKFTKNVDVIINMLYGELHNEDISSYVGDVLEENKFTRGHYFKNIL